MQDWSHNTLDRAGPKLTVVVPVNGDPENVTARLEELAALSGRIEILVSGDVSPALARAIRACEGSVVPVEPGDSAADQRSRSMEASHGDIVTFVDPAVPIDREWLMRVVDRTDSPDESDADSHPWVTHFARGQTAGPTARTVSQLKDGDRTVVIGGGPAGLTSAYVLAKQGIQVTVLEGTDALGGISQTAQYNGYRFDIGGHRFFTKYPPVQALWEEILGDEFISVPRLSRIYYNGKFFDYPLKAMNALRGLGIVNAVLIVLSYLKAHFRPNPVEETFDQWVTNRFGKRLYSIFFKTYTEKVWGISCTEIRAEWAAQRIQGLSLAKAILNAASLTKRSSTIKTLINEFQYPRLGPGQMWEMCTDKIRGLGGRVLTKHHVTELVYENGEIVAAVTQTPSGPVRIDGEHFITTMPVRNLVRALSPQPPDAVREAAEGLRYRDFLVVALMIDQENLFPDNWIYIHSPGVKVGRIQNFNNWSQAMVPEPGRTCIGMEYFCFKGDGLWTSTDEDLIELAQQELDELGLVDRSLLRDGAVIRMPKAYPIYDGEYREHLDVVRGFIDRIPNLHPVGRNGMHKYNNQDHSMLTALMTIWNMQGGSHDVWAVNTDFEYHEEIRVPDSDTTEAAAGTPA